MKSAPSSNLPQRVSLAEVTRFFVEIAILESRGKRPSKTKLEKLRHVLHAVTVVACDAAPGGSYEVDIRHVGYLKRRMDDVDLFIPFHLCRYFPIGDTLSELVSVSSLVGLDKRNPICISGSAAFLGESKSLADLDFCEYYLSAIQSIFGAVTGKWPADSSVFCVLKTKCISLTFAPPWPQRYEVLEPVFTQELLRADQPYVKIDGIYISDALGVLPVSNLVVPINPHNVEAGSATKSFVFQEAVLVRSGGPPRALVSASSLGGYLNFLKQQAEAFLHSDPLKSLKRALSFFLLTRLYEPAQAIVKVLRSDAAELLMAAKRQDDVNSLLENASASIRASASSVSKHGRMPQDTLAYAKALVQPLMEALAMDMLARIDELYAGAA